MLRDLGHVIYKARLEKQGLFILEKRKLMRDLVMVFQYMKHCHKHHGEQQFLVLTWDTTSSNSLKHNKIHLGGKDFLTMRVGSHWSTLPRKAVLLRSLQAG